MAAMSIPSVGSLLPLQAGLDGSVSPSNWAPHQDLREDLDLRPALHGSPAPHEQSYPPYWRNGAKLDLASVLDELRDRGFTIDGYDDPSWYEEPEVGRRRLIVEATAPDRPDIVAQICISHDRVEPYTLWIYRRREDADGETRVRTHTTTAAGLLRSVDAFLAGMRVSR
jgi:hypothetical protein